MPLAIEWPPAGPSEEQVRTLIAALQQGRLVGLATDVGYVAVASATHPRAGDDGVSQVRYVPGTAELPEPLPGRWERVLNRLWPGPLGVSFPSRSLRFRSPRHPVVGSLLSALGTPLAALEPVRPATSPAELAGCIGDKLDIVVDSGSVEPTAISWLTAEEGWRTEQLGALAESDIRDAAAVWIVFVCTGNTCRSPMAESLFRSRLAQRLGCRPAELPARGFKVFSAGVSAYPGDAASAEAIDAVRGLGGELDEHRSRPLTMDMVAQADHLVAMTRSHLLAVLSRYPQIGGAMRLLCGPDGDLDDPIGGPAEVYADCARTIDRHLNRFIEELVR